MSRSRSSLLKDGSWIRKLDDEDESVDRDPNFGRSVLSHLTTGDGLSSPQTEEVTSTKSITTSTSVQALSKRYYFHKLYCIYTSKIIGSEKFSSRFSKSNKTLFVVADSLEVRMTCQAGCTTTTTTTVTKDGKTTETTVTTSGDLRSPIIKSPTKTDPFSERVLKASNKGLQAPYSPTKTTKVTETTVISSKDAEDKLYDTLIPKTFGDGLSPIDSKTTISSTETVLVKSSPDVVVEDTLIPASVMASYSPMDGKSSYSSTETVTVRSGTNGDYRTTTTTRSSSSTAEDDLYDKLLPRAITSSLNSPIRLESPTLSSPSSTRRTTSYSSYSDDIPSLRTTSYTVSTKSSDPYDVDSRSSTYSYSRPDSSYEYTSITGPSSYSSTTYRSSSSRSDDGLSDSLYSKSSTKSLYSSSDRAVLEKDLCTYCHKPFDGDAKMVLEEMKINCHATCFKCEVCKSTLAHLKAGDSMWVYKHMVHCENCFETTRERWKR
ncbi:sciellin isoform X1 [Xyrichtys novacula]|uniref:Sciellin isoform X1 n=1 Tax=Xyrichtys novacula TaxID=13765 RepID=A0AAV1H3Q4_XYRNO|nr:sciellin isoform X1 [Xyrichtys novacula]